MNWRYYAEFALLPFVFVFQLIAYSVRLQKQAWLWTIGDMRQVIASHKQAHSADAKGDV